MFHPEDCNQMPSKITLIGSTGLIGLHFLESIREDDFPDVTAITRRKISNLADKHFIRQAINDFSDLESMRSDLKTDVLVSTLGTTIKKAGSQDEFFKIDHDLPLRIARMAHEEGCRTMILVSSGGANPQSSIFYCRVKGLLEEALSEIGFDRLHILRPSLLLGPRTESRPGEYLGKLLMQPLSFLIPWKYRPIHARIMANTIQQLIRGNEKGHYIWEGKDLYKEVDG